MRLIDYRTIIISDSQRHKKNKMIHIKPFDRKNRRIQNLEGAVWVYVNITKKLLESELIYNEKEGDSVFINFPLTN